MCSAKCYLNSLGVYFFNNWEMATKITNTSEIIQNQIKLWSFF